jgi:hypothetical protein
MRWVKIILVLFFVLAFVFTVGEKEVFGGYTGSNYVWGSGGLTAGQVCTGGCPQPPGVGSNGGNNYSGFYYSPITGNYYPIVSSVSPGSPGDGPANTGGVCTGIYDNCGAWGSCSTSCGAGTQDRNCFDTGCGAVQVQSQSCMVNDPTIWGTPTTCSVKCGGGTQDHTNQCGTTETIACNTSACPAWTKLKDSSYISVNPLSDMLALAPVAYDADDTTDQYFIVGADGVVAAPLIDLDISNLTPTAKTGNPEYKAIYTPEPYSLTPSSFLSYVKARKDFKTITDLGEITGSGIYVFNGNVAISSNVTPFNQSYKVVLISTGTVTISAAPDNTFTPTGMAAIVASEIDFDSNITEAHGIFVADTIQTGTNATQGLKIVGNLIAQTSLSNNREWPTTSRPSLFIKFDQTKYIDLLPYFSTASYQWRQIQ